MPIAPLPDHVLNSERFPSRPLLHHLPSEPAQPYGNGTLQQLSSLYLEYEISNDSDQRSEDVLFALIDRAGAAYHQRFPPPPLPEPCHCPPPPPPQPPLPLSSVGAAAESGDILRAIQELSSQRDRDRDEDKGRRAREKGRHDRDRDADKARYDRDRAQDKKWRDSVDIKLQALGDRLDSVECELRTLNTLRRNACGALQGYGFEPICNSRGDYPGPDLSPHLVSHASIIAASDAQIVEALAFYGLPPVLPDGNFGAARLFLFHWFGGGPLASVRLY